MTHYVRIFADADGQSHFEDVTLPTGELRSPVSSTVFEATDPIPFKGGAFRRVVHELPEGEPHRAPRRQFVVHLAGFVEVEASDGEVRRFGPGSVLLADDLTGVGHITRNLGPGQRAYLQIPLDD